VSSGAAQAATARPSGVVPVVHVVTGGLNSPLDVADAGDGSGRIFVAEQAGRIRIVRDETLVERPFLDITDRIASGGERGLLGIAFHPGYPTDPRVFVDYTDKSGNTVVSSFRVSPGDPDAADPGSEVVLLHVTQPFANHNGGGIHFGPDGKLYIALGDGGSGGDPQGNGQRLDTLLAKILRIDVDATSGAGAYAIPPDNPFLGTAGAKPEIWLTGLRNPWRFSFDPKTGALSIGDVGQDTLEEVDYTRKGHARGANFGWSAFEGTDRFNTDQTAPNAVPPIFEYSHDGGACSITGGYVVRDRSLPALYGRYVYGDFCIGDLHSFVPAIPHARNDRSLGLNVPSLSSFGEDNADHIYVASLNGPVYRLVQ
jgi:glucose/arabinose dehydrogenase